MSLIKINSLNQNRSYFCNLSFAFCLLIFMLAFCLSASAQGVKRIVVIKVDGLPSDYVDRFVRERDPVTGRSKLPWFNEVFYKNGTRLSNFYVRGMSLSGPSWSLLDTGQHLQIKGNVEYDRLTLHSYDYLNFFPYYVNYGFHRRVDMPGVEVMDQLNLPLLADAFAYEKRYLSYQLYQRGNQWEVLASGFVNLFPRDPASFIDEWTLGFNFRNATMDQNERDIIGKLEKNPNIDYFDFYTTNFDHVSHHNRDTQSRLAALKELDGLIGRIWTAILASPRADETALFIVSDHGFNSDEKIYSQGFNIVKLLASANGGGHHIITKRRLMLDYSVKGIWPLVPLITTTSDESYYLKGESADYPTALVDFDGNERSSIHLRDNDLNILHIIFKQLKNHKLSPQARQAATETFFNIIDHRRNEWQREIRELNEELDALHRWIESQQPIIKAQPKKFTKEETAKGLDKESRRIFAQTDIAKQEEIRYREYIRALSNLLALKRANFDAKNLKIEDYISKGAMGARNTIFKLQNYVVGPSEQGFVLTSDGKLDVEKSFKRINYPEMLHGKKVINTVQQGIGNRPIDFVATHIPLELIGTSLSEDLQSSDDPIWLYGGPDRQALILTREDRNGQLSYRFVPIANLTQQADGKFTFEIKPFGPGFPLKIWEDEKLNVPSSDKEVWLNGWHTELEWLHALHKTQYSNALIGLHEQLDSHSLSGFEGDERSLTEDEKLIRRYRWRQRRLAETDLLILANNHWNFDVRGFNPGGNHGSFFRISTNSTLMMTGGRATGIPRGLNVEEPYDSLSFMPTVLTLMGKIKGDKAPMPVLYQRGFRKFPGRIIQEVIHPQARESIAKK
jgi:hypothetical protein